MRRCFDFMKHFQFHKTLYLLHKNGCKQASFFVNWAKVTIFFIFQMNFEKNSKYLFSNSCRHIICLDKFQSAVLDEFQPASLQTDSLHEQMGAVICWGGSRKKTGFYVNLKI